MLRGARPESCSALVTRRYARVRSPPTTSPHASCETLPCPIRPGQTPGVIDRKTEGDCADPRPFLEAWLRARPELVSAVWLGRGDGAWGTLLVAGGSEGGEGAETPDGFPWPALALAEDGTPWRWGQRELRAWPALLARGVREGLLWVGDAAARALWLEARAPGALAAGEALALVRSLLEAERRCELEDRRRRAVELEARAKLALANRHDLRNELILAQLELERAALEPENGLAGLRRALEGARRLSQEPLDPRPGGAVGESVARGVRLEPLLREELRAAARIAGRDSEVRVVLRCAADLRCASSPSELGRWVRNAVLNALRVSPAGGAVRVEAEVRGDGLRVSVTDAGPGMDAATARRLFEPGRSATGGSGFGSAALEACARVLGAAFELETEPGVGTRLSLDLPGAPDARTRSGESGPPVGSESPEGAFPRIR